MSRCRRRKSQCGSPERRQRHEKDPFVRRARSEGWRSRAALKLEAVDQRDSLFRPGQTVVDLGAAPGGWCQYAQQKVGAQGFVLGIDLLAIEPLPGVTLLQEDFAADAGLEAVREALGGREVDVVLSDMAPNLTGHSAVDQPAAIGLAELAADFAGQFLKRDGDFLVKVFHGEGFDAFRNDLSQRFSRVLVRKPDASRAGSREVYLLARGPAV